MGDKVYLGKPPISLDPALQKGETQEERRERLRTGKFEDRTPLSEKIGNKIGDALYPVYKGISSMVGNDRREAKRQELKDRQKQYEVQDKQEGRGMKKGGSVSSASKRADGIAVKGKTRGKIV